MLLIAYIGLVLSLVWAFTSIYEFIRPSSSAKASMTKCMLRFGLEAHFELMICAFITQSNPSEAGSKYWILSMTFIVMSFVAMLILAYHTYSTARVIESDTLHFEDNESPTKV